MSDREWLRDFEDWAHLRHHHASAAPSAATATIRTSTPGGPVSFIATLKDDARSLVAKLEAVDENALNALEAVLANQRTNTAFALIASLAHVDPTPELDAVLTLLKALAPQPATADGQPSFTPSGPQVAGQA